MNRCLYCDKLCTQLYIQKPNEVVQCKKIRQQTNSAFKYDSFQFIRWKEYTEVNGQKFSGSIE
jgi:hypothetical protein